MGKNWDRRQREEREGKMRRYGQDGGKEESIWREVKGERKELRGDDQRKMERKGLERKGMHERTNL